MTQNYTDALPNARKIVEDAIGTSTEHTTNLKISGAYTFSSAIINVSVGLITLDLAIPDAPTDLAATVSVLDIVLTWLAPLDIHGSAITGYTVYRGTGTGVYDTTYILGDVLTYTDTVTEPFIEYYYAVTAINGVGESVYSSEIHINASDWYCSMNIGTPTPVTDYDWYTSMNI